MRIYFVTIAFYLLFSYFYNQRPRYNKLNIGSLGLSSKTIVSLFLVVVPVWAIIGLKAVSVGSDTISYFNRYDNALEVITYDTTHSEMGFNLFNLFLKETLHFPWQGYLLLVSLLICIGQILFVLKYSDDIFYSFFVYITIGLFTMHMSGIRQSLAVSICMVVLFILDYKDNNKNLTNSRVIRMLINLACLLLILIATSIHNSSFFFLIIFFIRHFRLTRRQVVFILLAAVASYFYKNLLTSMIPTLEGTRYSELEFEEDYAINPLVILITIAIPLAGVKYIPTEADRKYSKMLSMMFLFAAFNILFRILSINQNLLGRMSDYFVNCYLVLVPAIVYSIKKNSSFFQLLITLLCIIAFYMGTSGGTLRIDNYKFYWQ